MAAAATIDDLLDGYDERQQQIISRAFKEGERIYKNHLTRTQRDAVGRTAVKRLQGVIRRLQRTHIL
jgi:hypothetical protein